MAKAAMMQDGGASVSSEESVGGDVLKAFQAHCAGRSVLLLEDDPAVGGAIQRAMSEAGCGQVVWVTNGLEAVEKAAQGGFDLLIFDRNTPGIDGREALERIRAAEAGAGRSPVPAMFLTALGVDRQRLEGLVAGADDYLVKPVSDLELLARAAALLRRSAWAPAAGRDDPEVIDNGPLVMRPASQELTLAGKAVKLTGREYAILTLLAHNLGLPVTRSMIWDRCWPEYNFQPDEFENRIDVHASRLRKRLEAAADEAGAEVVPASARPLIISIRNQGLMLRKLRGGD
jgi:two-component system OmpR family response regulator